MYTCLDVVCNLGRSEVFEDNVRISKKYQAETMALCFHKEIPWFSGNCCNGRPCSGAEDGRALSLKSNIGYEIITRNFRGFSTQTQIRMEDKSQSSDAVHQREISPRFKFPHSTQLQIRFFQITD